MQQIPNYIGNLLHVRQTESPFQVFLHQSTGIIFKRSILLFSSFIIKKIKVKRSCKTNRLNLELTKTQVPVHSDTVVHDLHCFIIFKKKKKSVETIIVEQKNCRQHWRHTAQEWLTSLIREEGFKNSLSN